MYSVLALLLLLGGGYLSAETTAPMEHRQLQSWFDGSSVSPTALNLEIAQGSTRLEPVPSITPEDTSTSLSAQKPKPSSTPEAVSNPDACEDDLLECAKKNWRWLVLTTLGGTTAFLLHKFITVTVEGGPVLAYGLLLGGFLAAMGLVLLVSYLLSKKKKKSN